MNREQDANQLGRVDPSVGPGVREAPPKKIDRLGGYAAIFLLLGLATLLAGLIMLIFFTEEPLAFRLSVTGIGLLLLLLGFAGSVWADRKNERDRRLEISHILGASEGEYFERLVNINVENLSTYYITVKSHANKSFMTSLFVGVVGFILIGVGMSMAMRPGANALTVSTLSGVSGVATEFISAIFFYLYNQTVRQMKEYHDSLLSVQNILLSFKLVGDMSDPEKSKMIGLMINYLVGQHAPALRLDSPHAPKRAIRDSEQPNGHVKLPPAV